MNMKQCKCCVDFVEVVANIGSFVIYMPLFINTVNVVLTSRDQSLKYCSLLIFDNSIIKISMCL